MTDQKLYQSRTEYQKARQSKLDPDQDARETPSQQSPGRSGYRMPDYASWTREELLRHAQELNIEVDEEMSARQLQDLLQNR